MPLQRRSRVVQHVGPGGQHGGTDGVAKERVAGDEWYDLWFNNLAPSLEAMKLGRAAATPKEGAAFNRRYEAEMATLDAKRTIELLAASLSRRISQSAAIVTMRPASIGPCSGGFLAESGAKLE